MTDGVNNLIWSRTALSVNRAIGRKARDKNRIKLQKKREEKLLQIVREEAEELLLGLLPPAFDDLILDKIVQRIADEAVNPDEQRCLHNYFCTALDRGNRKKIWQVPVPASFLTLKREPPIRDEHFFRQASRFKQVKAGFELKLTELDRLEELWSNEDDETLVKGRTALILFSAIAYGGLSDTEVIIYLLDALAADSCLAGFGDYVWVDIEYNTPRGRALNIPGENATLHRWFLDDTTLHLFAYFYQLHGKNLTLPDSQFNRAQRQKWVLDILNWLLVSIDQGHFKTKKLSQFCDASAGALERHVDADIPSYLTCYAIGVNPSYSLPASRFNRLLNHDFCRTPIEAQAVDDFVNAPLKLKPIKYNTGVINNTFSDVSKSFLKCFYKNNSYFKKSVCIHNLNDFLSDSDKHFSIMAQLLAQLAIGLLSVASYNHRKPLAVSTVYGSYIVPISKTIITLCESLDPTEFDESDFELLYEDTLNKSRRADKGEVSQALAELHHFLVTYYDCDLIDDSLFIANRAQLRRVKALVVSEAEFRAALKHIQSNHLLSAEEVQNQELALFLGYRVGLRLGEVCKLRLKDILIGKEVTITIRSNRYGNNKTTSSLRRLDLSDLMAPSEFEYAKLIMSQAKACYHGKSEALLISDNIDRCKPIDSRTFRETLHQVLRLVTGEPNLVFQSLRHSCLSFLLLHLEEPLTASTFLPTDAIPIAATVPTLTGSGYDQSFKKLQVIAAVAGHSSPSLTLSTYIHCLDILLAIKCKAVQPLLSKHFYARMLGKNVSTIENYLNRKNLTGQQRPEVFSTFARKLLHEVITELSETSNIGEDAAELKIEVPGIIIKGVDIFRMLRDYERGQTIREISERRAISEEQVQQCITSGVEVANIVTRKGKSRLINNRRIQEQKKRGIKRPVISPGTVQNRADLEETSNMTSRLKDILRNDREEVVWCVKYFLGHIDTVRSGIRFADVKEARRFISLFSNIVNKPEQIVVIHRPDSKSRITDLEQRNRWQMELSLTRIMQSKKRPLRKSINGLGQIYLTMVLEGDVKLLEQKNTNFISARGYKYVFHLLAIALHMRGLIKIKSTLLMDN